MKSILLILPLMLAGCGDLPRDPEGTLDRVRAERDFKAGIIAGPPADPTRLRAFLERVERAAGARASVETGAAEPLLHRLESGGLDIVVGPMTASSAWNKQVHFLPPLRRGTDGQRELDLVAMARNGENAWISLLHREADAVGRPE